MLWIIIPARRGSTGVPDKNIKPLPDGSTCLSRALGVARAVADGRGVRAIADGHEARIVVTTDYRRDELGAVTLKAQVITQPPLFAESGPSMLALLAWVCAEVGAKLADTVCLLQPDSPLRRWETVDACVSRFWASGVDSYCTAQAYPRRWHPSYVLGETPMLPHTRQSLAPVYRPDGGCYVSTVGQILKGGWGRMGWIVSPEGESLGLDTPEDWAEAERRIRAERPAMPTGD